MKKRKKSKSNILLLPVYLGVFTALFPVIFMAFHSFDKGITAALLPKVYTWENWKMVLLQEPGYLVKFWKSIGGCAVIVTGQLLISLCGGAAFAKYEFPFKRSFYVLLLALMLLPVQATLVPNYVILKKMKLLGSWWSLILPSVFLPFGTVFLAQIMKGIPDELLEAARLDGAGELQLCMKVIFPFAGNGAACLTVLTFIEAWNMVEQPMVFLERPVQFPLSVFLASAQGETIGRACACGLLTLLPVVLLYLYFKDEFLESMEFSGVK